MSENENQPPSPSKQTSSVPLKKETVRVTLKAADAPPAVPSATVPMAPPVRPPTPSAPSVAPRPAPAPTIPLRTAGPPAGAPAPTVRLATSAAPMRTGVLRTGDAPVPSGTAPTLPKATVQLQAPTQPLGGITAPSQADVLVEEEEVEEPNAGLVKVLAGVGFAAAIALLAFQLVLANKWISAPDQPRQGEWSLLLE